jgi:hypothetical protein
MSRRYLETFDGDVLFIRETESDTVEHSWTRTLAIEVDR